MGGRWKGKRNTGWLPSVGALTGNRTGNLRCTGQRSTLSPRPGQALGVKDGISTTGSSGRNSGRLFGGVCVRILSEESQAAKTHEKETFNSFKLVTASLLK